MGNKKLSTDMARYIWSIIAKEPLLPMSWGVDLETVVCSLSPSLQTKTRI